MRRLVIIALVLLTVPSLVVWRQYCATYRDEGSRANYLEIEEPGKIDLDPAKFRAGGVPILCYHYLRGPAGPVYLLRVLGAVLFNLPTLREREYWTTPAELFARHMDWLLQNGYTTIDLDELEEILAGKEIGPAKPIVITFDDGDTSILRYAYPFLTRHGMKATIMVVTSKVGQSWKDVNTLSWAQLGMLEKSGVFRVESHSDDMHYKVKGPHGKMQPVFLHEVPYEGAPLPRGEIFVSLDLRRSSQSLKNHLGHGAQWLAWPYGWASSPLDSLAAKEGYHGSLSLAAGTNEPGRDSTWHLARITVTARTTLRSFQQLMRAAEREAPSIAQSPRTAP
jgi:peptidoglycan/xylan/chitin deacetylase (PgdA/CDA1 family)